MLWTFFLLQENFLTQLLSGSHLDILLLNQMQPQLVAHAGRVPMLLHRPCWGGASENWAVCILPTCARSLLKMSSSQDWLIVSMQGGHTAADEREQVAKSRIWREIKGRVSCAEEEKKIVMDECVGCVIYVQTRYIDMQKRVGPTHLWPHNMHRAPLCTMYV